MTFCFHLTRSRCVGVVLVVFIVDVIGCAGFSKMPVLIACFARRTPAFIFWWLYRKRSETSGAEGALKQQQALQTYG